MSSRAKKAGNKNGSGASTSIPQLLYPFLDAISREGLALTWLRGYYLLYIFSCNLLLNHSAEIVHTITLIAYS
jgi:hypothetical protein